MAMSYLELLDYLQQVQRSNPDALRAPAMVEIRQGVTSPIHSQMDLVGLSNLFVGQTVRYRTEPNPFHPETWRSGRAGLLATIKEVFPDRDFITVTVHDLSAGQDIAGDSNWWIHNVEPV